MSITISTLSSEKSIPAREVKQLNWPRIILLIILAYEALGALLGGFLLVMEPNGQYMNMPVSIMHGVFADFMIPGLILSALGVLNALAFVYVLRKNPNDWLITSLALGGFVIWFVVEIIILKELHWLHLMWGLPVLLGCIVAIPMIALRNKSTVTHRRLLMCGILSSLYYIAVNIYVPVYYEGYSHLTYTVSELSAINAPSRILWVLLVMVYPLLFAAFGWGVFQAFGMNRSLRSVGILMIVYSVFNLFWPPMHMRGADPSLTDTMHIVWAFVTNIFMWLFMIFGAVALGKHFRIFTILSIALHLVFGVLTMLEAPNIATNGPTPFIGLWERINIFIFMLWVIVFAMILIKKLKSYPIPGAQ